MRSECSGQFAVALPLQQECPDTLYPISTDYCVRLHIYNRWHQYRTIANTPA